VGKSDPRNRSFDIPKRLVWEAYKSVKKNEGAAGVDTAVPRS
jgi:RNA-directed DNA polymerase